jgi:signal transduction histidine kinase
VSYRRAVTPRRPGPPARVVDVLPVAVLVVVALAGTSAAAYWHGHGVNPTSYLWVLGAGVPLLFRRRFPLSAFGLSAAATLGYYLLGHNVGPTLLLPTLGLSWLAYRRDVRLAVVAGGVVVAVVVTAVLVRGDVNGTLDPRLFGLLLWAMVAIALGTVVRLRRSVVSEGRARAVERERRLAEEERLRIAREVHDVVAHSLAMINVQAGVAAHVADRRPEQAKAALLAIKEASRTALTDLRATLDVLRSGGDRAPTPGLARLPDLIANATAAGVRVRIEDLDGVLGDPDPHGSADGGGSDPTGDAPDGDGPGSAGRSAPLDRPAAAAPAASGRAGGAPTSATPEADAEATGARRGTATLAAPVDLAAYRILQESLTNVVRHAAGADRVTIRFERVPDGLRITVRDNGAPPAEPTRPGNGLRGMVERAAALGGEVSAGPAADGGFEVRAWLPLPRRQAGTWMTNERREVTGDQGGACR